MRGSERAVILICRLTVARPEVSRIDYSIRPRKRRSLMADLSVISGTQLLEFQSQTLMAHGDTITRDH